MASRRRRAAWVLAGLVVGMSVVAAVAGAGALTSMNHSFGGAQDGPGRAAGGSAGAGSARPLLPPTPSPEAGERRSVAVVLGVTGSVGADVLAPFDVLARSRALDVYTISAGTEPVALSGGLGIVPQHRLDEVTSGALPPPDLIVVPAVVDPTGEREAPTRAWIVAQASRGARVLGVCAGSSLLAASGVLDGRTATSHWWTLRSLIPHHPEVHWVRGERYVQDGPVTTTAGITSGVVGALRLVQQLAGDAEAERIGRQVAYPGWTPTAPTAIPAHRPALGDLPYVLNLAFPWGRPALAVGLVDGVSELDVAAVAEVYDGSSWAAALTAVGTGPRVRTAHGVELVTVPIDTVVDRPAALVVPGATDARQVPAVLAAWAQHAAVPVELPSADRRPGESPFEPLLRDLARRSDQATATSTARFIEYPPDTRDWSGARWPRRSTTTALLTLAVATALGTLVLRRGAGPGR